MKYLTLTAAAVMTLIAAPDAKAGCDSWFDGSSKCNVSNFSGGKLNPEYWGCRSLFLTGNILCRGIGIPQDSEKLSAAKEACKSGGSERNCQKELQDIVSEVTKIKGLDLDTIEAQVKTKLDADVTAAAKELVAKK